MVRPRTVLVAEADPDLRDAIESLLARSGYHTVGTGCGLRAVELASEHRVAVAVVGLLLPGQSGLQVLAHLKARHGDAVPVVMTSEVTSAAHRDLALASGAERFLPKPLAVSHLLDAVAAFLPPVAEPTAPRPAAPAAATRPMARIGA